MIVGILGLGSIGSRHAVNLSGLGRRTIAFDPNPERRRAMVQKNADKAMPCEIATSREDAINNADAVVIASPNRFHLSDLRDIIRAGRHAFVEKPLSHADTGVDEIIAEADRSNLTVFAGFNLRFNPAIVCAKAMLAEDALGTPYWGRFLCGSYLPNWRQDADYRKGYAADPKTGGVIFDIIHEFDLATHLLGPATTVAAEARNTGQLEIESEDCADIVLKHESGVHSNIHIDYITRPSRRRAEIAASEGLLEIDVAGRSLKLFDHDNNVSFERTWQSTPNDEYIAEMKQFLACIENGEKPCCDGKEALKVLQQVLTARKMCGLPSA